MLTVGRHALAKPRRKSPVPLAVLVAPVALFFAVGADVHPEAPLRHAEPAVAAPEPERHAVPPPCCMEVVASPGEAEPADPSIAQASLVSAGPGAFVPTASRWRHVDRTLPVGVAPERGLQVLTILTARSVSDEFPEIHQIGGVRPDALRWHPNGLALDVMIPNPSSAEGIALGNAIVNYVFENTRRFGIQDAIWRGVYYTPGGAKAGGYGHYDHVHITTKGGGYPTGGESYLR